MTSSSSLAARRRGRRILLLVAAVFVLPVAAAWGLFFAFPQAIPEDTTHHGELIAPARPTDTLALIDADGEAVALDARWTVLLIDDGRCAGACAERLLMTRQMRLTLNDRISRVQRVLLVPARADVAGLEAMLREAHPDLRIVLDDSDGTAHAFFAPEGASLHLLDPLGNYLMRYRADVEPAPLRKDIVRLLRASRIG